MIAIRIENTTGWRTEDLKEVIVAAADHRGYDLSDHHIRIETSRAKSKHRRPQDHLYSGIATLNGSRPGKRDIHLGVPPVVHHRSDLKDGEERGPEDLTIKDVRKDGMEAWYRLRCRRCGVETIRVVDGYDFDGYDAAAKVDKALDLSVEEVLEHTNAEHSCKSIDVEFDVERFAQVVLHEMDHSFQGLRHKDMLQSSELEVQFVDGLEVEAGGDE